MKWRKVLKVILIVLLAVLIVVGGYVAYVFLSYHRIADNQPLEIRGGADGALSAGQPHTIVTWNLGFGAYSDDYTFFMDGGKESWARSADAVRENIGGAVDRLRELDPDLMLLEEVDFNSTRSYHIDQRELIYPAFEGLSSTWAQNYDSPFLCYPLTQPHGASKSCIMTFAKAGITSAVRRSLPIETSVYKVLDLDRCYSVSRIPTDDGRELCLYCLHLSAYTSDGTIATDQLIMLLSDMKAEYDAGNYVIAGGDFNKDLLGNSPEIFGVSGDAYTWAQPIDLSLIPEGLTLQAALDPDNPVPSCRNCDVPYVKGETFVVTVDGFITSDNISVEEVHVEDEGFRVTDHNPVVMTFTLGA